MLSVTDTARRAMHRPPPMPNGDALMAAAVVLHRYAADHDGAAGAHAADAELVAAYLFGQAEALAVEADTDAAVTRMAARGQSVTPETRAVLRAVVASMRRTNRGEGDAYPVTVPTAVALALTAPPRLDPHGLALAGAHA